MVVVTPVGGEEADLCPDKAIPIPPGVQRASLVAPKAGLGPQLSTSSRLTRAFKADACMALALATTFERSAPQTSWRRSSEAAKSLRASTPFPPPLAREVSHTSTFSADTRPLIKSADNC